MTDQARAPEGVKIPPPPEFAAKAHVKSFDEYQKMYNRSIRDPDGFWGEIAEQFYWKQKWTKVRDFTFRRPVSIGALSGGASLRARLRAQQAQ